MAVKQVVVLGASGSIGRGAADVLAANRDRFAVYALAAKNNIAELAAQAERLKPQVVITAAEDKFEALRSQVPAGVRCACGMEAMEEIVQRPEVDIVLCAIVGTGGIRPVLAALRAGKKVALASKEVLVLAGELVMKAAAASPGGGIIPVDSEHSGVFQCLAGRRRDEIAKIWLTASGGPFRTWDRLRIERASLQDALAHPTWNMGQKITIDSASMMNKALELVEAKYLFNVDADQLGVIVNPQSIIHALAELTDGSMIAQMSVPDMRLAIGYALAYPERPAKPGSRLDLSAVGKLELFAPDKEKFPSLQFADAALRAGGTLPAVMNAANEVAVERFCRGEINFGGIWKIVETVMNETTPAPQQSLEQVLAADAEARVRAWQVKL
ncbi:MAG: 1-deoxy-D-xylulose-5-phosphate reductoisomerase [Lentisphaerae bacterium]|nr:1-deoxy-D-xylulose-5-phosphate reductoisomerase [Lentisphaerota bacterium]